MSFISKILDTLKMESTREMENKKEMSLSEALVEISRANKLAGIANKTTDREEFYNSIAEIEDILTELSKHEHKFGFSYPPSANLRDLRRGMDKQIELLEKRIEEKENIQSPTEKKTSLTTYNGYYENIVNKKENNLQITYEDVEYYDLRPFELNKPFISDGHFMAIELEGRNLEKAYEYLHIVHGILEPYKHFFENADFPNQIGLDYWIWNPEDHLPISHLRLSPYTATMKNNKYPFWLWLSHCNDCGAEYIYMIYFNQDGEIGKADLNLYGSNGARLSYESKIRRNENGLYVMRINKTLYVESYGTKILYHYQDDVQKTETEEIKPEVKEELEMQESDNSPTPYQGTNFNRKIASEFEGLFSHLSPEMPLFQALSGISFV